MSGDEQRLNPQIRNIEIGVRNLRKIKIYPMSMADQAKFGVIIQDAIQTYLDKTSDGMAMDQQSVLEFAKELIVLVKSNIQEVLKIVTDLSGREIEEFFDDITNLQMSHIAEIIVKDNFEEPAKNVLGLVERVKELFLQKRPSQQSLNGMGNTTSATFTEEASGMAA